jgi:catechol 2,3-dioxygenase-like lactoylglutathione lyase family enzyme
VITRFSHWSLAVANIDRSAWFYESILGCTRIEDPRRSTTSVLASEPRAALQLERDGQRFQLLERDVLASPSLRKPQCNHLGLSHLTVAIDSADALIPELDRRGVAVRHHTLGSFVDDPGSGAHQFLFEDPDGNLIETFAPADPLSWNVFTPTSTPAPHASAPSEGLIQHLSHFSLGVSDPESTIPFYERVMGLELVAVMEWDGVGPSRVMDVGDASLTTWLLTRDGQRIEIIHFARPASPPRPADGDQLGLSHLTVEVDDVASTAESLEDLGIVVKTMPGVRDHSPALIFTDPEGNLIQAISTKGDE